MKKAVNFPSLSFLSIQNFELYPDGLVHNFLSGINVAVGVNGIGKTTLLRSIYRAIAGVAEIRDSAELGEGQRKIFSVGNVASLFGPIARDGAESAEITLGLKIGAVTLEITRSLKTLKLIGLKKNRTNVLTDGIDFEAQYQTIMPDLMGVPSFFDVLLVLRYVVFALEDRRSIVWDSDAQVELLQIFLYPTEDQRAYRISFNDAMKADSTARNYQSLLSKEEKSYRSKVAKIPSIESVTQLEEAILTLRPEVEKLDKRVEFLDEQRKEFRGRKLRLEDDLLQQDLAEERIRELHLAAMLPELDDYGAYIVSRLEHGHCLICGSTDMSAVSNALKKLLKEHKCPLCTSETKKEIDSTGEKFESIYELGASRQEAESQRSAIVAQENLIQLEFRETYKNWVEKDDELSRLLNRKKDLTSSLGASPSELLGQHKIVRQTLEAQRDQYRKEKDIAVFKLKSIAAVHLAQIKGFCEQMSKAFNELISTLLAEKCILSWSINERNIGQGTSEVTVAMPTFLLSMTSGVYVGNPAPRYRPNDVSESQRELIDLAFRLSIMKVFAPNEPVSVLTETPDDGLDVAFIPNYATVLRDAAMTANPGSTFLVTANLNGSSLIKLLVENNGDILHEVDGNSRVIDLLHRSAKTAAVTKYGGRYDDALFESTGIRLGDSDGVF